MKRLNTYINEKLVINKKYRDPNSTAFIDDTVNNLYLMGKDNYETISFTELDGSDDTTKLNDETISKIIYQLSNSTPSQNMVDNTRDMFYDIDLEENAALMKYDWRSDSFSTHYREAYYTKKLETIIRFTLNNARKLKTCYFTVMKYIHILFVETADYFVGVCYYAKTPEILKQKNKPHRICSSIIFKKK